ncbi:unnamed protein product [Cuscuta epithymum]|uniref:Uncharacterized protein n=1 Tax=Cuscuta epithymum TaxID=186058 RepID=A0AAV0FDX2_9ASTE|nr:unnamed protein product [Cuscuta epithymum]
MRPDCTNVDEAYEFLPPRSLFTERLIRMNKAKLQFKSALIYASSPWMPTIKTSRFVKLESLCDVTDGGQKQIGPGAAQSSMKQNSPGAVGSFIKPSHTQLQRKQIGANR